MTAPVMRDCRYVSRRLPLYAGGDLPMEIAEDVARHLAGCADCLARLRFYQGDRERLAALQAERLQLARPLVADDCWSRVQAGIRPTAPVARPLARATDVPLCARKGWVPLPKQREGGLWAAAAAVLLALGLGGWWMLPERAPVAGPVPLVVAGSGPAAGESAFVPTGNSGGHAPPFGRTGEAPAASHPRGRPARAGLQGPEATRNLEFALGNAPEAPRGGDAIAPALVDFMGTEADETHYPLDDLVPVRLAAAEQGIDF